MNMEWMNGLSAMLSKARFAAAKHLPDLLAGLGTVSVIGGTVLACKASTKAPDILGKANEKLDAIRTYEPKEGDTFCEKDRRRDLTATYAKTGASLAKLYAPGALLIGFGLGSLLGGNHILKERNASLAAAYAVVDRSYKVYRDRVKERYGEEADRDILYDRREEKITVTETDADGKKHKVQKTVKTTGDGSCAPYARFFGCGSRYWESSPEINKRFLISAQSFMQRKLETFGYLFLNDVYDALGYDATPEGQVVGWIFDPENPKLENRVDFGMFDPNDERKDDFFTNIEEGIWLNFNVDGNILHSFEKARRL